MNLEQVEKIADAVLYEGYMLYPYSASAVKNQQRWNFGVLSPQPWAEQQVGADTWTMQTECLLETEDATLLNIEVRFLQIVERSIHRAGSSLAERVDQLTVEGKTYTSWQEAIERTFAINAIEPAAFALNHEYSFEFPAGREIEPILTRDDTHAGEIVRAWKSIAGFVDVRLLELRPGVVKIKVRIENATRADRIDSRADALAHAFISTHTILGAESGSFVSSLDPPRGLKAPAADCRNIGTFPVLVGEDGARDAMLSSPIILYDYPQIAPESLGSLFDGTEIDEILSLRILTLTDAEKQEMRQADDRARAILERTEAMPAEQFMKLHGAWRGLRPVAEGSQ